MPKKKQKVKSGKLPKAIAGVRITKELRSAVQPVLRFAGSPLVSDILSAALIAGAESLTKGKKEAAKGADGNPAAQPAEKADAKGAKSGKSGPVGLMLAVAAGEIASQIVAAYQAPPKAKNQAGKGKAPSAQKPRRAPAKKGQGGTPVRGK